MRRFLAGAVLAIAMSAPAVARAQKGDDVARADSLFSAAKALLDAGQNAEACGKFAESKRLAPGLGVTLFLADCYERIGKTASAWTEFRSAEGLARERNDKRADVARDRAQALEAKLDRLIVTVAPTIPQAGLQVLLDGAGLSPEEFGLPTPVDPGDHVVVVMSQGRLRRTISTHLGAETQNATIRVDSLDEPVAAAPAPPVTPPPAETPAEPAATPPAADATVAPAAPSDPGATMRWIGIGSGGLGVIGIGTSIALGLSAKSKEDQANQSGAGCASGPERCLQGTTGFTLNKSAVSEAGAATAVFAIGAVALAAGVVLFVVAPHGSPAAASVAIAPAPMTGGGGAILTGRF